MAKILALLCCLGLFVKISLGQGGKTYLLKSYKTMCMHFILCSYILLWTIALHYLFCSPQRVK